MSRATALRALLTREEALVRRFHKTQVLHMPGEGIDLSLGPAGVNEREAEI